MKLIVVLLLLLLSVVKSESNEWDVIYQFPVNTEISYIASLDSMRFVVSGVSVIGKFPEFEQYTFIAITKDGGYSWENIFENHLDLETGTENLKPGDVEWVSDSTIFAGLEGGLIIYTNNLGETWDTLYYRDMSSGFPVRCFYLDINKNGYGICLFSGVPEFLITDDGGINWEIMHFPKHQYLGDSYGVGDIERLNENDMILNFYDLQSYTYWIARSSDKGETWDMFEESYNYILRFTFFNDTLGYMGGSKELYVDESPIIKKTTDGGKTWNYQWIGEESEGPGLHQISFYKDDNPNIIFAKNIYFIFKSLDGGLSWRKSYDFDIYESKIKVLECSNGNCLMIKMSGDVYKFFGSVSNVEEKVSSQNNNIFPNPLNRGQTLNIEVEIEKSGEVAIDLINTLGVKVSEVYRGYLSSGKRMIYKAFRNDIPSGYYFLRMTFGDRPTIVKALVIE